MGDTLPFAAIALYHNAVSTDVVDPTLAGLGGQGTGTLALVPGAIADLAGNAAVLAGLVTHAVSGTTQPTTLEVSTTPSGLLASGIDPSTSGSGRVVAFTSLAAAELTGGLATDGIANVVVRDTLVNKTALVSLDPDGAAANGASGYASISADGTEIAFASDATHLVAGTAPGETNIYVAKLTEGDAGPKLQSIEVRSEGNGQQGEGLNGDGSEAFYGPVLSADGSTVAFDSTQALVPGAESGVENVYAANMATGDITLVSGGTGKDEYAYTTEIDPIAGIEYSVLAPAGDKPPGTGGDMESDVTRRPRPAPPRLGPPSPSTTCRAPSQEPPSAPQSRTPLASTPSPPARSSTASTCSTLPRPIWRATSARPPIR